ncbi:MAG: DUF4388 domain-containing protein [Planctomycetota bacterium]|nr:DUF4388 domain-containing protein [Planctomycetota bacterium]
MSFQGDVRGIGLAELLQGLARGRKEGTLTLTAKGAASIIGLEDGKAQLLPDPEEDAEQWRTLARDAWADSLRVDYLRMSVIARAHRLEYLYDLLDGGDVHFRFEPGLIPRAKPGVGEEADQDTQVFCDGMPVEFLLLEYARVADELDSKPEARAMPADLVPCLLDPAAVGGTPLQLLEHCDGRSTVAEIADRMGWPVRQACLALLPALKAGGLRRAHPSEVLDLALAELKAKHVSRAAVRIQAWCRDGEPGPLAQHMAELLESEWLGGRLSAALRAMPAPRRRTLLRRLDHGLGNSSQTVVHWLEATRLDKTDRVARLKRLAAEFREGSDPDSPDVRELLDWARDQRETGHPWRAGPALVMAALRQPTNTALQLDLGTGLVAAGRPLEGAPWVIAASREFLEQGHADRAMSPLRALLAADPRNREGRQLLSRARRQSSQVRKLRKNLLIGLALTGVAAVGALVKVNVDAGRDSRLEEVRLALGNPRSAVRLLEEHFKDDHSPEIMHLRDQIQERQRVDEFELRSSWLASYNSAQLEATKGDPLAALGKIRAIGPTPKLVLVREPWPDPNDLYSALSDHLTSELDALGEPVEGSPQQVAREDQIRGWAETLIVTVRAEGNVPKLLIEFTDRLEEVQEQVDARRDTRNAKIDRRLALENLEVQDKLYREGVLAAEKGDLVRALQNWEDCVALDETGKVEALLEERIAEVRAQLEAVREARRLAQAGQHAEAIALLVQSLADPSDVILPWRVDSYPTGVRVTQGEARAWTTPFSIETTLGETVELTFERTGFLTRVMTFGQPADQVVHLEREPERAWTGAGRVDAIPVPIEGDHIVVDRDGNLARCGPAGEERWTADVKTLSGIARAPVFLSERPGHLLLVTEDGDAWILSASDGALEGPWQLGAAPQVGPAPNAGHVRARLTDGRMVVWSDALKPVLDEAAPYDIEQGEEDTRYGATGGMAVARRRAGDAPRFPCPWLDWVVVAKEHAYVVHPTGNPDDGYSILRAGEWEYLAWESASEHAPFGRLWVSDDAGIRAYVPLPEHQVVSPEDE